MRILITGITGFVGSHLAEYILSLNEGHVIYGICRWRSPKDNLANIYDKVTLLEADLTDLSSLIRSLKAIKPDIIFHLAAQSYVLTSFNSPIQTLTSNVIGTANLLEAVRITEADPVIHVCSCYDEETEVLTKKGFLKYNEIKKEDMVLSIDPETKIISYMPIKKIIIQDYAGTMKRIKTRSLDLLLTPNHQLLFSKRPKSKLKFQRIDSINKLNSRYYLPQGKYSGITRDKISIGNNSYNTNDIFYLMGLYVGDGYSGTSIREVVNRSGLNRSDFLKLARDTKGRFKGLNNNRDVKTLCHSHRVFLAIPEGDKARESVKRCLERLGVKFKLYKNEVYFSSQQFVEFLNEIGHSADNKDIPEWVFDYDSRHLKFLYQGLIDSDGYYYGTGERFHTVSKKLADSLTKLCLSLGKFVTVSRIKPSNTYIKNRIIRCSGSYIFSISEKSRLIQGKNIKSNFYKGKIWCLEIDKTHNFVVRRNGKTVFCGNSSEVYGQVTEKDVPIREDCPLRPASPYAVSKVAEDMLALQYWLSYKIKTIRTRMFTHSVSKWTPVIIRDSRSNLIDIKYISEIRSAQKKGGYLSGKLSADGTQIWDMSRSGFEIWNDNKWSKIKHISCHPIHNNKLLEIACRGGVIDVTGNHSIVNEGGKEVKAAKLAIDDKVKLTPLPKIELTSTPEQLAWLYGFFVAEGCVTGGRMRIDNKDISKLKKAQNILLKFLAVDSKIIAAEDGMYRLTIRKPFNIAKRFYYDCYASDRNKKIPKIILNADKKTKLAFLRGYNTGDGDTNNEVKSEFYRFKTKSPILASGLCYLVESTLGVKYRITVEHRQESRYFEIRCLTQKGTKTGKWLLKDENSVIKITELKYTDEVWDFETENHWFHGGIGGNIVHNTGPRRGGVFAMSFFAKQAAAAELGLREPVIHVGNLKSVRTFCDVRDAVRAYWLLVNKCPAGEVYNIGGDRTVTIEEALKILLAFSNKKFEIKVDPVLLRPSDVTLQIPCTDKFRKETGWRPEIPLEKTLQDILDYWRVELSRSPWKSPTPCPKI